MAASIWFAAMSSTPVELSSFSRSVVTAMFIKGSSIESMSLSFMVTSFSFFTYGDTENGGRQSRGFFGYDDSGDGLAVLMPYHMQSAIAPLSLYPAIVRNL